MLAFSETWLSNVYYDVLELEGYSLISRHKRGNNKKARDVPIYESILASNAVNSGSQPLSCINDTKTGRSRRL